MKNDQNLQFDSVPNGRNASEHTYSYIFSEQTVPRVSPKAKKAQRKGRVVLLLSLISLCVCLALAGVIGGAMMRDSRSDAASRTKSADNAAPDPDRVLTPDPDSVLVKSGSSGSAYGSADGAGEVSAVLSEVQDAVVTIRVLYPPYMGYRHGYTGSGVIVSEKGYILTCHHVVENARSIEVMLSSGEIYGATLVGGDTESDLAVIMIDPGDKALTYVTQGCSADLAVGERVVAVGDRKNMDLTVTTGTVSDTACSIAVGNGNTVTVIQTDAAIDSGKSGGGLFNLDGELIGIVNARYSDRGDGGVTRAIPIDSAYEVEKQLIQYGYVRGIVDHGLTILEVTQSNLYQAYRQFGIQEAGLYVYASAHSDELQTLDRILSVNGQTVTTLAAFEGVIDSLAVGDRVTLVVKSNGKSRTVSLVLEEYVPDR